MTPDVVATALGGGTYHYSDDPGGALESADVCAVPTEHLRECFLGQSAREPIIPQVLSNHLLEIALHPSDRRRPLLEGRHTYTQHPYTQLLVASIPQVSVERSWLNEPAVTLGDWKREWKPAKCARS